MVKNRKCVICPQPARSREHIFPASFGGLRINKGIYCGQCNNKFGSHVAVLLDTLGFLNASIGVIPSGKSEIRPATLQSLDGTKYHVVKGRITLAPPPPLAKTPELVGKKTELRFADMDQATKWMQEQKEAGFGFTLLEPSSAKTQFFTEPIGHRIELGTEPFMRALLYIGLTFVAHDFPEVARSVGLKASRDIIDKNLPSDNRVWWVTPESMNELPPNPFEYGHTVAISVDSASGKVSALVSLFGGLHFGIDFGLATMADTMCVVTHVDPLANSLPADMRIERRKGMPLTIGTPAEGIRYLHDIISGRVENTFASVLRSTMGENKKEIIDPLLGKLKAIQSDNDADRIKQVEDLLLPLQQTIFFLLKVSIDGLRQHSPDLPPAFFEQLQQCVGSDDNGSRGLSAEAEVALGKATSLLAKEIANRLRENDIDEASLFDLLNGPTGTAVILGPIAGEIAARRKVWSRT